MYVSPSVVTVYRPDSEAVQSAFFEELAELLDTVATRSEPVYLVGDLNIRLDRADDAKAVSLTDLFSTYGLDNRVSAPTHQRRKHCLLSTSVRVEADHLLPSRLVRDLGIFIDNDVTMRYVTKIVSGCFAVLRQLRSISRSLPDSVFQSLVVALVMPRLDYCNATLAGLPVFHRRVDYNRFSMLQPG